MGEMRAMEEISTSQMVLRVLSPQKVNPALAFTGRALVEVVDHQEIALTQSTVEKQKEVEEVIVEKLISLTTE